LSILHGLFEASYLKRIALALASDPSRPFSKAPGTHTAHPRAIAYTGPAKNHQYGNLTESLAQALENGP
jgi:hypothetical protein